MSNFLHLHLRRHHVYFSLPGSLASVSTPSKHFPFLQITFFAACLSLVTKWESEGRHCVFQKTTVPDCYKDLSSLPHRLFWLGSRPHKNIDNLEVNRKESAVAYFFQNWYGPILMQPVVRILTLLWYCVYLAFGIYGCFQLREGLEPINLLVEDSYAIPHYRVLEQYFWHYGPTVQVRDLSDF